MKETGKRYVLAVHLCVDGKWQDYLPSYNDWASLDPVKDCRLAEGLTLAHSVWRFYYSVAEMLYDIQHELFRLGRLAGLTSERLKAYMDRVGDISRLHIAHTIGNVLPSIGLFRPGCMAENSQDLPSRMQGGWDPVMILDPSVCVVVGPAPDVPREFKENARPVFDANCDYFNAGHPKALFVHILNGEGVSMLNSVLELGILMFGELPDPDAIRPLDPAKQTRTEIFARGVRQVFAEALLVRIREWGTSGLCIPCPECTGKGSRIPEQVSLYLPHLTSGSVYEPDVCKFCGNTGITFTEKVVTITAPRRDLKATYMANVDFPYVDRMRDTQIPSSAKLMKAKKK